MNKCYYRIVWKNYPDDGTPLNEQNLNKVDVAADEMDNRIISLDATKFDKTEAQTLVKYIEYDEDTGVFKITHYNGTSYTIDTLLEKLAINFDYDYQTQRLIIELSDGTVKYVDLSALITQYEFLDSETIDFILGSDGKVTAKVKEGSIQEKHLRPNYLADVKVEVAKAEASAGAASESQRAAKQSEDNALSSANASADSAQDSADSAAAALESERNSRESEEAALGHKNAAKVSEDNARVSEEESQKSKEAADASREAAETAARTATKKATEADEYALRAQSYAVGTGNVRPNEASDSAKFYYEQVKEVSEKLDQALRACGTITFEELPDLSLAETGDMYNISNEFVTDERFKEGTGWEIPMGANVYKTARGYWDVLAGTPVSTVNGQTGNVDVNLGNIEGVLPISKGGTGKTTAAEAFTILAQNATNADTNFVPLDTDTTLLVQSSSTAKKAYKMSYSQLWKYIRNKLSSGGAVTVELTNQNLDTIKTPGFYYAKGGHSVTGMPSGETGGFGLIVVRSGNAFWNQILYVASTSGLNDYERSYSGSTNSWRVWHKLAIGIKGDAETTYRGGNVNLTADDIGAISKAKLLLSGNTAIPLSDEHTAGFGYVNTLPAGTFGPGSAITQAAMYKHRYDETWESRIYHDYRTGRLAVNTKNNGTWIGYKLIPLMDTGENMNLAGEVHAKKLESNMTTTTHLSANKGNAIINSTQNGEYIMLAKMNSANGVFTLGIWNNYFGLFYTPKSTIDNNINECKYYSKLLDENGIMQVPIIKTGSLEGPADLLHFLNVVLRNVAQDESGKITTGLMPYTNYTLKNVISHFNNAFKVITDCLNNKFKYYGEYSASDISISLTDAKPKIILRNMSDYYWDGIGVSSETSGNILLMSRNGEKDFTTVSIGCGSGYNPFSITNKKTNSKNQNLTYGFNIKFDAYEISGNPVQQFAFFRTSAMCYGFTRENDISSFLKLYASSFVNQSSRRYKENIKPMSEEEGRKILQLEPVSFDYKEKHGGEKDVFGFIAEDANEVIPHAVTKIGDVPDGIDYSRYVAHLVKMVQIHEEEIRELRSENESLKNRMESLEKMVSELLIERFCVG